MDSSFIQHIFEKHHKTEPMPSAKEIASWAERVLLLLFPEQGKECYHSAKELALQFEEVELELTNILLAAQNRLQTSPEKTAKGFTKQIPEIYRLLQTDIQAILAGDPAAKSEQEVIIAYPGFFAISMYRVAHTLHRLGVELIPRILTEYAHSKTGIDIHPGASIDDYFFIDHGTGIVIGETTHIGKHVKLYQGVTLGALSVEKTLANQKRHPTVEDYVVIYAGATILGGETVIGEHSIIGGNVWITKTVPAYSTVYHKPEIKVVERESV